ncbi:MAG: hypothetical protein A2Z14_14265 [Chloroflexi bacterium RBG_16_48_8]|nr:MAG: hypothetical protein A2Z14_14265 [Chloroflexi bacterium RBG_16_48_8]
MKPRSISAINKLELEKKQDIYTRFIPGILFESFHIPPTFLDPSGNPLLRLRCDPGTADVVIELKHAPDAQDPLLYAHLTDTVNGQIHVLLYVVNDVTSQRFNVDRMPDGSKTQFGIFKRNLEAEEAAMRAGLAPGQVRRGLRILRHSIAAFESFVSSLDHDLFFAEPLYYHNAILFESYGFAYLKGRRLMERINLGFLEGHEYQELLNYSSPFRFPEMANSIRGRSWAIHDGILGHAFDHVTMYKSINRHGGLDTFSNNQW